MKGPKQYICKYCNFQVKPKNEKMPTRCPYCSANDCLLDNTPELGLKELDL